MTHPIEDVAQCTGCTACASVCGHKAIQMQPDNIGFLYPKVNVQSCTNCGLCTRICPIINNALEATKATPSKVYAFRASDEKQLMRSQSGGAFFIISDYILSIGGVVYGATIDNNHKVKHIRATNADLRDKMRGSKYVQSNLSDIYASVRKDLLDEKTVLFSGTPCQVSGLKSFVNGKSQNKLYTIDLICNGVSSPKIWDDYLKYLENKYRGHVEKATFRDKKFGWHVTKETFIINGKEKKRRTFMTMYFKHLMHRESCYNCVYTNFNRCGDLTIGDFWGWDKICHQYNQQMNDDKGVSLVLSNSEKGDSILTNLLDGHIKIECALKDCIQPMLVSPVKKPIARDIFLQDYQNRGFEYVAKKYSDLGLKYRFISLIYRLKGVLTNNKK